MRDPVLERALRLVALVLPVRQEPEKVDEGGVGQAGADGWPGRALREEGVDLVLREV